jgi:serpin B
MDRQETQNGLVKGFNSLGLDLLQRLDDGENCFLSPLSIGLALGMLTLGAKTETRVELERLLNVSGLGELLGPQAREIMQMLHERKEKEWGYDEETQQSKEVERVVFQLHLANALFLQEKFQTLEGYQRLLTDCFSTECSPVNFGEQEKAANRINDWVQAKTNGFIKDMISPEALTEATAMVLVNAIHFLADWRESFPEHLTRPMPFYPSSSRTGDSCDVAMMRNTFTGGHYANDEVEALSIPFKAMSMVVALPKRATAAEFGRSLDATGFERILHGLSTSLLDLDLPKFSVASSFSLKDSLETLGLESTFNAMAADFSGITPDPRGLFVTEVLHQARIRVDEEGVEAAAATAIIAEAGCAPDESEPIPIRVEVNSPFVFFIVDPVNGSILFAGRVVRPTE